MQKNRPAYLNTFTGGMNSDAEAEFQPQNTYRKAVHGRIIFNADGTYAFENDNGNLLSFTLKDYDNVDLSGYTIIGWASFADKVVLFSTNGTYSEIGYVTFNNSGIGTYQQIFNDQYDPNGDTLDFGTRHNIEAVAVKETEDTERVYFTDNNNEFRVVNILLGDSFDYTPTGAPLEYPYWYSVHSMNIYCDWKMGVIKYNERIAGSLKTGVYQYTYRQGTKDGYRTQWYPITRHFILSDEAFGDDYQMGASGVVSPYGFELEISGIDQRYPIIEVAYVYSISETQTVEAAIFYSDDRETRIPASTLTVEHTTHSGDPILLDEFNLRMFPLRKVKSLEEKDNNMFLLNVKEVGVLQADVSSATITPKLRLMEADMGALNNVTKPYQYSDTVDTTIDVQNYAGTTTSYQIKNEPATYAGTAYEHLFTSYWRGETYRFGVLLFDNKGMANFVAYLDDYTFPEQFDASGDYTLTKLDGGKWKINIMGAEFNNIVIPADVLYDADGNLQVSGFSIVRAKRVENTRFQGVVMPTVYENDATDDTWQFTRPLPMTENFFDGYVTPASGSYTNNSLELVGTRARSNEDFALRSGTVLMYSPEILFGYKTLWGADGSAEWSNSMTIRAVGVAGAYGGLEQNQPGYNRIFSSDAICHYYSKNYVTSNTWSNPFGNTLGQESHIEENLIYRTFLGSDWKIEDYDNVNADLVYTQFGAVDFDNSGSDCSDCNIDKFSWGMPNSVLCVLKDFKSVAAGTDTYRNQVLIANWREPNTSYFSGEDENAIEKTLFISTGHFQPINAAVIADTENGDGDLVFNGVEVWGGDCYPYYFNFTRLLPQYRDCATQTVGGGTCYEDYSVSMIVPLESNINHALRFGRTFNNDSVEPEDLACGFLPALASIGGNGVQEKQREDFNINSVLMHEENLQFFNVKPADLENRVKNPLTILYSQTKYYGEPIDSYRRFLANDIFDLTGVNGDGVSLFRLYNYIYFLQERGFGRLYINQPATLSSPEQGTVLVGSGGILTGALYISQSVGCQHQFSVTTGHNQAYWVDVNLGKHYRFDQNGLQPISDTKGQHTRFFDACKYYVGFDNPAGLGGIFGVYDYKNNEVTMFLRRSSKDGLPEDTTIFEFGITYSENIQAYTSFQYFKTKAAFPFGGLWFAEDGDNVYVQLLGDKGNYFGELFDTELEYVVTTGVDAQKIYDICQVNVNEEGVDVLSQCRIDTDINGALLSLLTDDRVKYRHGFLQFPLRSIQQSDRIRGKYAVVKLTVVNADDKLCRIPAVETKYRVAYNI